MARFNTVTNNRQDETVNYEGGKAFKLGSELELTTLAATTLLGDKFYKDNKSEFERLIKLIRASDPTFVAKLAAYVRNELHLRSIPIVLLGELFGVLSPGNRSIARKATYATMRRVDDMLELAAYVARNSQDLKSLPKQFILAIKQIFEEDRFDEYQYAKYDRKHRIRPRDLMNLTHPRPKNDGQNMLFKKLKTQELETPYTWETQLSARGNTKEVWEELIDSKRLGYFATIRNVRNMLKAGISDAHLTKVCEYISNETAVKNSKLFPFRFYSAWNAIKHGDYGTAKVDPFRLPQVKNALEKAIEHTVPAVLEEVVGEGTGRVLIACDTSGSMRKPLIASDKYDIRGKMYNPRERGEEGIELIDVGLILGATLQRFTKTGLLCQFDSEFHILDNNAVGDILGLPERVHKGGATNGWKIFRYLTDNNISVDKVFIFTDCQLWDSKDHSYGVYGSSYGSLYYNWVDNDINHEVNKYWAKVNPKTNIYIIDLAGYGTSPIRLFEKGRVKLVAGWGDAVFKMLSVVDKGDTMISYIKSLQL